MLKARHRTEEAEMICSECGNTNPEDSTFCQKCGKALATSGPASEAPPAKASMRTESRVTGTVKRFDIAQLLLYGSVAAIVLGVLVALFTVVGMDHVSGSYRAAEFFSSLLRAILIAGVLAGLSELISSRK